MSPQSRIIHSSLSDLLPAIIVIWMFSAVHGSLTSVTHQLVLSVSSIAHPDSVYVNRVRGRQCVVNKSFWKCDWRFTVTLAIRWLSLVFNWYYNNESKYINVNALSTRFLYVSDSVCIPITRYLFVIYWPVVVAHSSYKQSIKSYNSEVTTANECMK